MSSPVSFINQLLGASDGNELVHVMRQSHDYNINEEAAPESFLDLLLVKAEALAFGPVSTLLVVELINSHLSHFKDAKFASNNINLLCRICDFLVLTLLPRLFEICKNFGLDANDLCRKIDHLLLVFEHITENIIQEHRLASITACSRPIMKLMIEALFQVVNDFDGGVDEFRRTSHVLTTESQHSAMSTLIRCVSVNHETFGTDSNSFRAQNSDCWFLIFECMGKQLTQVVESSQDSNEDEQDKIFRIERVVWVVAEMMKRFVPTIKFGESDTEKEEEIRNFPKSSFASSIAHNEQFWKGILCFVRYAALNFKPRDTYSSYSYSSLLASLVECLSFIVPKSEDVNHLIVGDEFVLCITSAPVVQFVCQQNNNNKGRQSIRNDTLTHYLNLLCNIAKVKPSSFRNVIMNEETGVLSRITKLFDVVADGCEHDIDRNLSAAFLFFGLVVDDFYKNDAENSKNVSIDDIVLSRVANCEQQLQEDQQDKKPQPIGESNSASSHPFATFIKHFCNTVLTKSLGMSHDYGQQELNIFHVGFGLDVLLRNFFPAGKRITWPDLKETALGSRICSFVAGSGRKSHDAKTDSSNCLEYVVEIARVLNRLNAEYLEGNTCETDRDLPSFYFQNSLQFARFLLNNRSQLRRADRLEILKLIASVAGFTHIRTSLWAQSEGECDQIFACLMRLMELAVWDSVAEFELVSRILRHFLENSFEFHPPTTSTLWSLTRTFRRMKSRKSETAFLNVIISIHTLYDRFVDNVGVFVQEFCSVLADLFPLIVTTANTVLKSRPSPCCFDELINIVWIAFTQLRQQTKNDKEALSLFYRPEFASMLIIMLDSTIWENPYAVKQCCDLLVGLHKRCDSLNKTMDSFVKNDKFFAVLHGTVQKTFEFCVEQDWGTDDELQDAYQQVCSAVFNKNENEMMTPQRREREENNS